MGVEYRKKFAEAEIGGAENEAKKIIEESKVAAESLKREILIEAKEEKHKLRAEFEKETMCNIKKGKDECLVKLASMIKASGGNGILDLDIHYSAIGLGGGNYQVTALGMGIYIS